MRVDQQESLECVTVAIYLAPLACNKHIKTQKLSSGSTDVHTHSVSKYKVFNTSRPHLLTPTLWLCRRSSLCQNVSTNIARQKVCTHAHVSKSMPYSPREGSCQNVSPTCFFDTPEAWQCRQEPHKSWPQGHEVSKTHHKVTEKSKTYWKYNILESVQTCQKQSRVKTYQNLPTECWMSVGKRVKTYRKSVWSHVSVSKRIEKYVFDMFLTLGVSSRGRGRSKGLDGEGHRWPTAQQIVHMFNESFSLLHLNIRSTLLRMSFQWLALGAQVLCKTTDRPGQRKPRSSRLLAQPPRTTQIHILSCQKTKKKKNYENVLFLVCSIIVFARQCFS